ncbi:hypothetical protein PQX77_014247 [Marasmius sp. AFHP31]|nr:hypothetical protein PQX77_014247 [Marasmius sp. AFHP31]
MPGSLFPRSPSVAPTVAGDYDDPDEDQPGPSKRARPLHSNATVRHASPVSTCFYDATSSPSASPRKGKQKALEEEPAEERFSDVDEDVLAMPPPPVPISRKGKERAGKDAIIDDWMRGKERELQEEQRRWERDRDKVGDEERERDKQRIQMLEEEVKRLRDELFKRSTSTSFTASTSSTSSLTLPPPPPPPPPPPAGVLIRVPTTPAPNPEALFASTRASLKHAGTPNEAPINRAYGLGTSVNSGKRAGKPTVGLQPDKIADFLKEMKSVKLRKVGIPGLGDQSLSSSLRRGDGDGGEFSFSFSSSSRRDSGAGNSSWQSDMDHILAGSSSRSREKEKEPLSEVSVGKKRKREEVPKPSHKPTKELTKPPSRVHNSSFASTLSVASSSNSLPSRPSSFTRNQQPSHPPSKPSPPTNSETAMPPPPLSRRSRSTTRSNSASSPPAQAPPRSKSPSTSIRRTSTSSAPSEHEASTSSYRIYTLPPGTNGPSRAWAPTAILPALPPPPPNETPSLCSDVPEGSTSVEDDELEDGDDSYDRAAPAPHVVVSPERPLGTGIGRRRRDVEDVDIDMEGAIDEDDDMGSRRNEKRPRLSGSPHQPYNMGESSNSSISPVQEHPLPSTALPPRFSTPISSDPPAQGKPGKPHSLTATAAFSRRVPVSPMPITPSPQRPRPPASRGRERERGRPRPSGEAEPTTDVVVALHDGFESAPRSRARSKSKSRSRPPTPHVKRTQPTRDEAEEDEEDEREKSSSRETDDVDAVKQEDEEVSSEDPLSLGQNTSAESLSLSQSQSEVRYRLDLSHSSVRSMPSRIPVARSTSLKRNKLGGSPRELARSAAGTSGSSTSHARPQAQDKPPASAPTPDNAGSSRRRTLDQELKDIVSARRSDEPDHYYEESGPQPPSAREMRRSTLTAVGTRNRRKGYLAHGGAGGVPVYVGNGYVAGSAQRDEDDDEGDYEQQEYDEVEAEGEEDMQDEDDLEYLPSPPKNKRGAKARSTNRR